MVGCLAVWAYAGSRARAAEAAASELRRQLGEKDDELRRVRFDLDAERQARVKAEALLEEERASASEQKAFLEEAVQRLRDAFGSLAGEALRSNSQSFLDLACQAMEKFLAEARGDLGQRQQAIQALVAPLREALERYEREVREMENARREAYGSLTKYLVDLNQAQEQWRSEARKLATALRSPHARGRWGEITLQKVVEMAGLSPYCDFVVQPSSDGEDGRKRPDLLVHLPGHRAIVVDAKVPLSAYLDAVEAEDEDARREALRRHAQAVRAHMMALGGKEYQSQFRTSIDFVVMFLPGDAFLAAAVEQYPDLIEEGASRRVLVATPITLVALLKAVAYGWRQQQAAENAERVIEVGRQLFERICAFADHLADIRKGLAGAVESYNKAVGSWQNRVVPGARRLKELGVGPAQKELRELEEVEVVPRELVPVGDA